jgi:2-polyprenyl-3-methyl-5-hydroxy-6-metoxy-1,4-benzoquinol methylase
MNKTIENFYQNQTINDYENSHGPRFEFLISDLKLDEIKNSKIGDFGCGYGPIFERMPKANNNHNIGFDGADLKNLPFDYFCADLSYDYFSEDYFKKFNFQLDYAFCFETIEHLSNPYHALSEIKKILKYDGILYLSIPNAKVLHDTIYPALLYSLDGFKEFLGQMAFQIIDHRLHSKSFAQEVFTLRNKPWTYSKMRFNRSPQDISPIEYVNL